MFPLTFTVGKHFIPLANKPLIYYPIETVAKAGIEEVAITYNPGWLPTVKAMVGDGSKWGINITYVLQKRPIGLANIFQVCEEFIAGDDFLLHLGDNIFDSGIKDLVEFFEKEKPDGMITKLKHPENRRMGVPVFDKNGVLTDYLEKPSNPPNEYAVPGLYFFSSEIFKCFKGEDAIKPSERGEYEIVSPYKWLIDHKYRVMVQDYEGVWLDPGKFSDWLEANRYLLDRYCDNKLLSKIGKGSEIHGRIDIGKGCKIENSEIRGPVSIADGVVIKDSFIGAYTSIGNNCRLEKCSLENSVLMNDVTIIDVERPIDLSLIGTNSTISKDVSRKQRISLFLGEMSEVKI